MAHRPYAVYWVASSALTGGRPLTEVADQAIAGGVTAVQLREKEGHDRDFYQLGLALREVCRRRGALFLVNDRVDLALALAADGVHLGQDDLPVAVARRLLGPDRWVGISVETAAEAEAALAAGASYLATGPVYVTSTKLDAGNPYGPAIVQRIRSVLAATSPARPPIPLVAIGGIHAGNGGAVIAAGADGLAVSSAVGLAPDPAAAAAALRGLWDAVDKFRR